MKTNPSFRIFKPALAATLAIVIACVISVRSAQAGYIVTLQQVGSNVVATGSGPIDLTGLTFAFAGGAIASIGPVNGEIITGPPAVSNVDVYTGFSGPSSFGSGGGTFATSGSGDPVGIVANLFRLLVPAGYSSGAALSDTSTYINASFSSLGVTPGIYEWTWGTGLNQNFTLDAVAPAVPDSGSTLGLLFVSLIGLLGARRLRHFRLA